MLRRLPRSLRLRVRIRLGHRLLPLRPLRRGAARACSSAIDEVMAIMLPSLREERRADLFAVPADSSARPASSCRCRSRSASCDGRHASSGAIRRPGERFETPVTGGHCKLQWKPDWAHALVRARRRLRDVGQGPDRLGASLPSRICRGARRHAAGRLQLRAVPRREGPEDLEVEGQRPDHRRMADLCLAGEPVALHVQQAARGQAALFRRHPAAVDEYFAFLAAYAGQDGPAASSATRCGTSMPVIRRASTCR